MHRKLEAPPLSLDADEIDRRMGELGARLVEVALEGRPRRLGEPLWLDPAVFAREMRPFLGWN